MKSSVEANSAPFEYVSVGDQSRGIKVHKTLVACIEKKVLPGSGVTIDEFWRLTESVITKFTDPNAKLLRFRDNLQRQIDDWYRKGCQVEQVEFLQRIGYIAKLDTDAVVAISTTHVDPEISTISAPQLVVPVDNARFVINAVNSRWGSLSAAIETTDVIGRNPSKADIRSYMFSFLDAHLPLTISWSNVQTISVARLSDSAVLSISAGKQLTGLLDPSLWVGWSLNKFYFKHNGLHICIVTGDDLKVSDVILESALTAILDLEDSVAAVDAADKAKAYSNWADVMRGTLSMTLPGGKARSMNKYLTFRRPNGQVANISGRVVALVRNVGIHCKTNIVLDSNGNEVYEGLVDAVVSIVAALVDIRSTNSNSSSGSVYIVKPKLHGPDEVRFACDVFAHIESHLGLPLNTVKIGIMDEERRTSVNLAACIRVAQQRVFFINTGFLDRTGDEIHTCMHGGPVYPKSLIKAQPWIKAYEDLNVLQGVSSGFLGRAQIGKGMWAEPDSMAAMMKSKIGHPQSAASTAWVPSPTAATLHAIHYHQVNVQAVQGCLDPNTNRMRLMQLDLLKPPIMPASFKLTAQVIADELHNNAQGVLGYVVRWIDQGVGCSKVPDIRNVGLMEDLATLRISSQHISNWLVHKIVTKDQVIAAFKEMAVHVDEQNIKDKLYRPMSPNFDQNVAFQVALELVMQGTELPNGYSIDPLVKGRRTVKSRAKSVALL